MRSILILILLLLIIAFSGCTGNGGTSIISAKDGVVITDFSFGHSPIYSEDNVDLHLEVQNTGGSNAKLIKIQIYGVDFSLTNPRSWKLRGGKLQVLDENFIDANLASGGELYRPDPDINLEGAKDYYEWRLKAPTEVTSETEYDFRVRVEYDYTTTYFGTIRIINDNYLRSLKENEKQALLNTGGIASSELTKGPITITPFSGRHFIVDEDYNPITAPPRTIKFKIENTGGGYPYRTADDGTIRNYYIKIVETGDIISNCDKDLNTGEIKLSSGESHIIDCDLSPPGINEFTNKIDKPFQIGLEYSYYIDGKTSITVKPAY